MVHCNTVFTQLLKLIRRHGFETLENQHHSGRAFRTASRWLQFVTVTDGKTIDVTAGRALQSLN